MNLAVFRGRYLIQYMKSFKFETRRKKNIYEVKSTQDNCIKHLMINTFVLDPS